MLKDMSVNLAIPVFASILIVGILGFSLMMPSTEAEIIPPIDTSKRIGEFGENVEVITSSHTSSHDTGKPTEVTLCHKGKKTITVSENAVPAHLRHGDTVGPCP